MGGGWRCSSTGKHDQPLKSGFLLYPSWSQWVPSVTVRGARNLCSSAPYANDTALPWGFITFLEERKDYV